jgi:hypothetical protein
MSSNTTRKKSIRNTGMIYYRNNSHPKHLKLDEDNTDCAAQVFQLLKFTKMPMSKLLQSMTKQIGLHYDDMTNILNHAYPKNNFEWKYLSHFNIGDLNKYLQRNQATILYISADRFSYKTEQISHYVALFRKNKKELN